MSQELNKFAWPGGYTILYYFTQSKEILVLCWKCSNKACRGIVDKNPDYEDYKLHSIFIHWEGESLWCDDCGVELPSEYGNPNEEEEPQIDAGELACEKTPTLPIPFESDLMPVKAIEGDFSEEEAQFESKFADDFSNL